MRGSPYPREAGSRGERVRDAILAIPPGEQRVVHGWLVDRYPDGGHDDEPYKVSCCDGRFTLEEAVETLLVVGKGGER